MTTLGFVVLARRPGSLEPVSAVFNGTNALEQAQNALEGCWAKQCWTDEPHIDIDPVKYVIGELRAYEPPESIFQSSGQTYEFGPSPRISVPRHFGRSSKGE